MANAQSGLEFDPLGVGPADFYSLAEDRQAEVVCAVMRLSTLGLDEVRSHFALPDRTIRALRRRGRELGFGSREDAWGKRPPQAPNEQDLRWRLRWQPLEQILTRFGDPVLAWIEGYGLADLLPEPAAGGDHAEEPPQLTAPGPRPDTVVIKGTNVVIEVEDAEDRRAAENLVGAFRRYAIDPSFWQLLYPIIQLQVQTARVIRQHRSADPKALLELGKLLAQQSDALSKLQLPERESNEGYELLRDCLDTGMEYLAQEGYAWSDACPRCGSIYHVFIPVYRRLIEFLAWAGEAVASGGPGLHVARQALERVKEDPFFNFQLQDLGMAWCQPLVELMVELANRHPGLPENGADALVDRIAERHGGSVAQQVEAEIRDWYAGLCEQHPGVGEPEFAQPLAAFFDVSEVVFDRFEPMSPLNRVQRDADGRWVVLTPEF